MKNKLCANLVFLLLLFIRLYGDSSLPAYSLHHNDKLKFGRLWSQIRRLEEKNLLHPMILERRKEIAQIKHHWKEKISVLESPKLAEELNHVLSEGTLESCMTGCGAAYLLRSQKGDPLYVVKPFDEDILCLNNRKHFASPYNSPAYRVRDDIPLYRSIQAEALAYQLAQLLQLDHLTPETHLAILHHEAFFDITDHLSADDPLLSQLGKPDREKLCSIQVFEPAIHNLYDLVEDWLAEDLPEEEILSSIDKEHFDELVLLIWLVFDTDAHAGNLFAKKSPNGDYTLFKIDNGLTFPEKNHHLVNALYFFPHAQFPLSLPIREKIEQLPLAKIQDLFELFELEAAYPAFLERVALLKKLCKSSMLTIREMDIQLHALECPQKKRG